MHNLKGDIITETTPIKFATRMQIGEYCIIKKTIKLIVLQQEPTLMHGVL
jgi:hypothetical protein